MLRIIIEQDIQVGTHPRGQTTARLHHMPARNGGPPAIGSRHAIHNSLTSQVAVIQHAEGTAQDAGAAPRILQARRKA